MKQKTVQWIKQSLIYGIVLLFFAGMASCKDKEEPIKIFDLTVKLVYPSEYPTVADIRVKLENTSSGMVLEERTNASGTVVFEVTAGVYNVSTTESRVVGLAQVVFNGVVTNVIINDNRSIDVNLTESKIHQVVMKELYSGGCQRDDGSGAYNNDSYVILYNNSGEPATLSNGCLAYVLPFNSNATNNDYVGGALSFEHEGWIGAGTAIWAFDHSVTIPSGQQIVIALKSAIDNTETYSNSINFANASYYCTYDPESGFNSATVYPPPAASIPTNHYLKAYRWGLGNAWPLSTSSPGFFVFNLDGVSAQAFMDNESLVNYHGNAIQANERRKVQVEWIVDAVDVFAYGNANNQKRFSTAVDAGYVELRHQYGFSIYRNVDKEATEAIEENAGKIVYNYSLGTRDFLLEGEIINGTTDPSGIDAEASMKNGARIVFKNTNNSSNDFHMRQKASLRN